MKIDLEKLKLDAVLKDKESTLFFQKVNKKKRRSIDDLVHKIHIDVFDNIDCLACANCCKTLGPRITDKDIAKLSKTLRLKPGELIDQYLQLDEDNDYIFNSMPCPFLMSDNYCMVYENRPKACREYPHTDRANFLQISKLSIRNTYTCPAVYEIIEQLKKKWK